MRNNTVQYMSSNNIRKIKFCFCLVVELISGGSVICVLFGEACSLCLWVAVRAGEEPHAVCMWKPTRIIVSDDPEFYRIRRVGRG